MNLIFIFTLKVSLSFPTIEDHNSCETMQAKVKINKVNDNSFFQFWKKYIKFMIKFLPFSIFSKVTVDTCTLYFDICVKRKYNWTRNCRQSRYNNYCTNMKNLQVDAI